MEHLGAVVRHLGRLAVMHLWDEPCVGHQARIGREDARDVLPQHDAPGAERTREQCRRQVRPTAAERRHAAVRRLPDEAGGHGGRAGRNEWGDAPPGEPRRGREVGRGTAVMVIGDDDFGGIDIGGTPAPRGSAPRRRSAPTSLAARDEQVARARGEVPEHADRDAELAVLARRVLDRRQQPSSGGAGWDEAASRRRDADAGKRPRPWPRRRSALRSPRRRLRAGDRSRPRARTRQSRAGPSGAGAA